MLVKWRPFNSLVSDPILDDLFTSTLPSRRAEFAPRIEIRETEKSFELNAELPGLDKNDFKLSVEDDLLILEGQKKHQHEDKGENYYRSERSYGSFRRTFKLGEEVDRKKIDAEYKNGVLKVTLPKAKTAKPKKVDVKIS